MRILGMGIQELLVVLFVCLLLFGANKLPEIGRSLGKAIQEFKKAIKEVKSGAQEDKANP